jgi:cation transport ATPase
MKVLLILFFTSITGLFSPGKTTFAQVVKNTEEITIKTSAVCGMCKERIEHDMSYAKGVKSVFLNLETKELTVGYNPKKTTPEGLRKAVSKIGYEADNVAADPKAYAKLPACCRKDAPPH